MFRFSRRIERTAFAAVAFAAMALGTSIVAQGFLPADPQVGIARARAVLDRAERVGDARALPRPLEYAQIEVVVR
jgi:hypothetical protein